MPATLAHRPGQGGIMASQASAPDVICPTCGVRYRIEPAKRRSTRRVRCRRCGAIIKVLPLEDRNRPHVINEDQIVAWLREGQIDDDLDD